MKHKSFHKLLCFSLFFLFINIVPSAFCQDAEVILSAQETTWLQKHPDIVLGFSDSFEPSLIVKDDGTQAGIIVDFIKKLNKRLKTNISIKVAPAWEEALKRAKSKTTDGMIAISPAHAVKIELLHTNKYFTPYPGLYTRQGSDVKKPTDLIGKTVVIVNKAYFAEEILKSYGDDVSLLRVTDSFEALQALLDGKADAMIGLSSHNYLISKYQLTGLVISYVWWQRPINVVMGIRADWPELVTILNKGIKSFSKKELNGIVSTWVHMPLDAPGLNLTSDERTWLKSHPIIRVGADPAWQPVESIANNGDYKGLAIDYLKTLEQQLGIRFEFVRENWQTLVKHARKQELDMFSCVAKTSDREQYLTFTKPYIEMPIAIYAGSDIAYIGSLNYLKGRKAAVVKDYAIHHFLSDNHPGVELVLVNNAEEGLRQVTKENALVFIGNILTTGHLISRKGYTHIKIVGETPYTNTQAIGVRKDWPVLRNILQKGLDAITEQQRNAIYRQWVSISYDKEFDYSIVWKIASGGVLLLFAFVFWNRKLASEVRKRTISLEKTNLNYQESQVRYKALFESGGDCIFILQGKTIIDCNEKALELFKYSKKQLVGMTPVDISPALQPDERGSQEKATELLNSAYEGVSQSFEWKHLKSNGDLFDTEVILTCIEVASKKYLQASIRDITNRKEAEDELRREHDFNMLLINASPTFLVTMNARGKVTMMNQAMLKALGYKEDEVLDSDYITTFVPEEDHKLLKEVFKELVNNKKPTVNENRVVAKDGAVHLVEWHGRSIMKSNDQFDFFFGVGIDITERKKLEKGLLQAHKMEAVGTLAGGIAHDFNNILSGILGYSELLEEDLKDIQCPDYTLEKLRHISDAGIRARDLVAQILAFSRSDEQSMVAVNVFSIAKEIIPLLRASLPSTIEIRGSLTSRSNVLADATQVHQIIMNLCTNAGYAMKDTGGVLSIVSEDIFLDEKAVEQQNHVMAGTFLKLSVEDTGCGMDEEIMNKIMEPFFTTKPKEKGTGMGLWVVNGIIKNFGGFLTITSKPGSGSTFDVYLPIIDDEIQTLEMQTRRAMPKGNETILFVDDEKVLVELCSESLSNLGYRVTGFSSSLDALNYFKDNFETYDLVISDMTMPEMTGDTFLREVQQIKPKIKTILCTGFSENIDEQIAKLMNIDASLYKPIPLYDMANTIRNVLDEKEKNVSDNI